MLFELDQKNVEPVLVTRLNFVHEPKMSKGCFDIFLDLHRNVKLNFEVVLKKIEIFMLKIINTNYKKAKKILNDNIDKLHTMAESLLTYETIDADQIDDIMAGATPREPKGWSDDSPQGKSSKKT